MLHRVIAPLMLIVLIVGAQPVIAASSPVPPQVVADAAKFRADLGFDASPSVVADMITHGQVNRFGLVLTPDEDAEWQRRTALREAMESAIEVVDRAPAQFAGVFLDQSSGDLVLHVNVLTSTDQATLGKFQGLLPPGANVQLHQVRYSRAELQDAREALMRLVPTKARYLAINVRDNRVDVTPTGDGTKDVLAIANAFPAIRVVDTEEVVASACPSRESCTVPWRGGTKTTSDGFNCTWEIGRASCRERV